MKSSDRKISEIMKLIFKKNYLMIDNLEKTMKFEFLKILMKESMQLGLNKKKIFYKTWFGSLKESSWRLRGTMCLRNWWKYLESLRGTWQRKENSWRIKSKYH